MTQNIINETENTSLNYKALYDDLIKQHTALKRKTKYGLVWEDKPEDLDNKDIIPLFKHRTDLSLNPTDQPMNYLIEGDNYHSLKVLQHTHKGKIDVIYIDPPYNTGNTDFVYNDKYVDSDDGFRHSKWLSFMDKRLRLARELLSQDGVIFVSIDDNEQAQLKLMMDKIFGTENYAGTFAWKSKTGGGNDSNVFVSEHEYIHMFAKNIKKTPRMIDSSKNNDDKYVYEDEYVKTRGKYSLEALYRSSLQFSQSLVYPITCPDGSTIMPNESNKQSTKHIWRWSPKTFERKQQEGRVVFKKTKNGWRVYSKQYQLQDDDGNDRVTSARSFIDDISGRSGTEGLKDIMSGVKEFTNPKPVNLIKRLVGSITHYNKSATVLDFFAGSGTTGHAVMELNNEDGGNRSFILCTNNEVSPEKERAYLHENNLIPKNNKTEYNKYKKEHPEDYKAFTESDAYQELGIAQAVTRERLKRVIEGYTTPKGKVVAGLPNNLTYLQTNEFPKAEVNSLRRKELANLALNSHILKYPESEFETFTVDLYFDIDDVEVTPGKTPTFFVNLRDMKSYAEMQHEITSRFGNHVIIQRFEDYYDINHDK